MIGKKKLSHPPARRDQSERLPFGATSVSSQDARVPANGFVGPDGPVTGDDDGK